MLVLAAAAATACLSPTLPLPPPGEPEQSELDEATGTLELRGTVRPRAWIYALNTDSNRGYLQVTGADGRYNLTVHAEHGDVFAIWYEIASEQSDALYLEIK